MKDVGASADVSAYAASRKRDHQMWQRCEVEGCYEMARGKLCYLCSRQVYNFVVNVLYKEAP